MNDDFPLYVRFTELKNLFFGGNIGRSTIDRWEREKDFPRRIKIGANAVVWDSRLVKNWIENRAN